MKKMHRIVLLLLIVSLVACLFAGCETEEQKIEKLAGTWTMNVAGDEDQAMTLMENVDLYEEEIALVSSIDELQYVYTVTFTTGKSYNFAYDGAATKEHVRDFYVDVFDQIFESRAALNEIYEMEFDSMTKEGFLQFYADLYAYDSFDTLLEEFVNNAYDYDELEEPWETGTYNIKGDRINCTITGESEAEYITYELEDDVLTLTYTDGTEVYTRK